MRTLMIGLLGVMTAGCGASPDPDRKSISDINGGMPDMTPGVVSVWFGKDYLGTEYCSGSIIAKRWVLTAAHCLTDGNAKNYFGSFAGNSGKPPVKFVHPHPEFEGLDNDYPGHTGRPSQFDIGLLELTEDASEKPLPIDWSYQPAIGQNIRVIGFGEDASGNDDPLGRLPPKRSVDLRVIMAAEDRLDPRFFANVGEPGSLKTGCLGDSGGPFLFNQQVVAVFTWSQSPCGGVSGATTTGVLIGLHRDWIMKTMQTETRGLPRDFRCDLDSECNSGVCSSQFEGTGVCT